ncbi:TetR/AcrR family transcriptional regulator [Kitasatospora phosalacinea]|uniref:TetR/AcrR family transcriptional regulator n=1 Tax=Kitasatospora phosalacinea TaxID=2065 RepID=UPI000524ECBC|nr:TetR family transcriptional regulator [Kitasatospora phosalacinea]
MAYDAEDTRRRIFAAASDEFAEHGLAGARVERIAKAAQANKQAIYLYYGCKEQLFAAVLRAKLEEVSGGVCLDLDLDAVAESVGQIFDWYQDHPELIRMVLWDALEASDDPEGEHERRVGFREKVGRLAGADPAADPYDADRTRAAQDLLFTVMGLISWNFAVPRMCRLVLDEESEEAALARRRETVIRTVRLLAADAARHRSEEPAR